VNSRCSALQGAGPIIAPDHGVTPPPCVHPVAPRLGAVALFFSLIGCIAPAGSGPPGSNPWGGKADGDESGGALRHWYVIGDDLTPGQGAFEGTVELPADVRSVEVWLDGVLETQLAGEGGVLTLRRRIDDLGPGEHELVLRAEGRSEPLLVHRFVRTHPLYVVVSNDWDDTDNTDEELRRQEALHDAHPGMLLTHFVGPYTFTDPALSEERKRTLADWVVGMRDRYGDEIGLHIHPYCHFVEAAGVECRLTPEYARSWRTPGYTVFCSAYTEDEMVELLRTAQGLFESWGLGTPRTFRAGGWSLELHVLRALGRAGFVADTSAVNWQRLEEWRGAPDSSLWSWNAEHWAPIDETSQPWYPSVDDLFSADAPQVGVLEVPDNGVLVDYVTADEMIAMFDANLGDGVLPEPRQYSIGYHPPSLSAEFARRLDDTLTHIDGHLLAQDAGPVVYARLSDLTRVWTRSD